MAAQAKPVRGFTSTSSLNCPYSAVRTKAKREHRIPLCGRVLEILNAARALGIGSPLVFLVRSGRAIAMLAPAKLLSHHGSVAFPRGFRFSFPDRAAEESDHPWEVIEAALAHVVQNTAEAAYPRSELFERRRWLTDDWATYLDKDPLFERRPVIDRGCVRLGELERQ